MTTETAFHTPGLSAKPEIASALHVARKASGLSQRSVVERARRLNCKFSASTLSNWESGKNLPNAKHLQALGRVYGTNFVIATDRVTSLDAEQWEVVRRILGLVGGAPLDDGKGGAPDRKVGDALRTLIDAVARDDRQTESSLTVRDAVSLLDVSEAAELETLPLLVVDQAGTPRYPSFQFDFARRCIRPAVVAVNELLDAADDSEAVLSWWSSANGRLPDGQSPRDLLDSESPELVIELAQSLVDDVG